MYRSIRDFKSSSPGQFLWLGHFHFCKGALCTKRLGNVPEGQEKQSDDIIQKLKLIYIFSFQGPTASFAIQQGVFFLYHVTVSCKDPLSWSNYHSWANTIAQIPDLILAIITDHMPLPLVKKTVEKFNCIPRQTGNFKVTFNLSLEFLHIFSPFFSSFIRRTHLSLQHQISICTIICTEDSIISTKSVAMGLTMQNCRPQE